MGSTFNFNSISTSSWCRSCHFSNCHTSSVTTTVIWATRRSAINATVTIETFAFTTSTIAQTLIGTFHVEMAFVLNCLYSITRPTFPTTLWSSNGFHNFENTTMKTTCNCAIFVQGERAICINSSDDKSVFDKSCVCCVPTSDLNCITFYNFITCNILSC